MASITSSWARRVTSYDAIPEIFREFIPIEGQFPYIIYSPPDSWGKRKTNAKLIALYEDRILVLEKTKEEVIRASYQLPDINYIEHATILLYSWISVNGFVRW